MEDLPDDILALIFVALPLTPKDKLALCAVSRRLRRAALDTLLLWSSIDIHSSSELSYLGILLGRSKDALLDVSIVPFGYRMEKHRRIQMPFDTVGFVAALLPHATRLRSLALFLPYLSALSPLLCNDLVLENLQKLVIHGDSPLDEFRIAMSAPQLRVLDVCSVAAQNIATIAPHATDLNMTLSFYADMQALMDELAANLSRSLSSLKLIQGTHMDADAPLVGSWIFPRLQCLDICVPSLRAVEMLQAIPTGHIQYVHVGLTDHENLYHTIVSPALGLLLRGAGDVVSFSIHDVHTCSMLSALGRRRMLEGLPPIEAPKEPGLQRRIWDYLCDHFGTHNSVTSSDFDTRMWHLYQSAFAERAPAGPEFTLRITPCFMSNALRPLRFPTLSKVVLMGNGTGSAGLWMADLDLSDYQRAVPWLARGALECSRTEVELCTCGISQANEREARMSLREWVREELQPEGCLSVEARCVIHWVLCSGICMSPR